MKKQSVLILFSACLCTAVLANSNSSDSSSEVANSEEVLLFIQSLINFGYSEDKLSAISDLIDTFSKEAYFANLTLIGSQNIYNADGTLKEIRTVELALPYQLWAEFPESDYDFDSDDSDKLREVREQIEAQSVLGFDMDFNYATRDKYGEINEHIYMDKDTTAVIKYDYNILNQTIEVENRKEAQGFVKDSAGPIISSVLCFDKDGNFIEDDSLINTDLLVVLVADDNSPPKKFIKTAKQGLAKAYLSGVAKEDIPEKLQAYLDAHYDDDTGFTVTLGDPAGLHIFKDYSITLRYNLVDIGEEPNYYIHGYKSS